CMDMCPEFERHEREYQKGLDPLERLSTASPNDYQVDHARAVKRYRRAAAGDPPPLPCDVRPPHVLEMTLDYLLNEILAKTPLEQSYAFVRDRTRSIRNDLTIQNYRGKEAVTLNERIARYHILCSHTLCDNKSVTIQQEHEQLKKSGCFLSRSLLTLSEHYKELATKNIYMPNEAEFQAYSILVHAYNNEMVTRFELDLPEHVFLDDRVQLALEMRSLMTVEQNGAFNNYAAFFRKLRSAKVSYLMACCLHLHFVRVRRNALKAMQLA
ncbi:SAC3/GANP/Nin1/mts3/eIF-3 p25, partial [Entophlyctis helioformis]